MPIYNPHLALHTTSNETLTGHLQRQTPEAVLRDWGVDDTNAAIFIFDYDKAGEIQVGDKLLIDGDYWYAIRPVVRRNDIWILRESRVLLNQRGIDAQ